MTPRFVPLKQPVNLGHVSSFESAGFSTNAAFNLNLIESLMFIFGTLTSWFRE